MQQCLVGRFQGAGIQTQGHQETQEASDLHTAVEDDLARDEADRHLDVGGGLSYLAQPAAQRLHHLLLDHGKLLEGVEGRHQAVPQQRGKVNFQSLKVATTLVDVLFAELMLHLSQQMNSQPLESILCIQIT